MSENSLVWDNLYLPCQSAEYEWWCGDRQSSPGALAGSLCSGGVCHLVRLLPFYSPAPRSDRYQGVTHTTRILGCQEGLSCYARMVVANLWGHWCTLSDAPHSPGPPGACKPHHACPELAEWTRSPAAGCAVIPRRSSQLTWGCSGLCWLLLWPRQDLAGHALGAGGGAPGGPCLVLLFPGYSVSLKWPRRPCLTWGVWALRAFLEGPSPGQHHRGRFVRKWLKPRSVVKACAFPTLGLPW